MDRNGPTLRIMAMVLALTAGGSLAADAPAKSGRSAKPTKPAWGVGAEEPGFPLSTLLGRAILGPGRAMLMGNQCHDVQTGRKLGQPLEDLDGKDFFSKFVLDSAGRYVAVAGLVNSRSALRVFSVDTGKMLWTSPTESMSSATPIGFVDDRLLVLCTNEIKSFDAATGQVKWTAPCDYRSGVVQPALDPTGTCFALSNIQSQLTVFSTAEGKALLTVRVPQDLPPSAAVDAIAGEPKSPEKSGRITVTAHAVALAFSPDGGRLAALFSSSPALLMIWDTAGKLVHRGVVPIANFKSTKATIAWSPDGQALVACGSSVYQIDAGRLVACMTGETKIHSIGRFTDADHVLVARPDSKGVEQIEPVTIPWQTIRESQAAMAKEQGVILPGGTVTLAVEVANVRGDPMQTSGQLWQVLTRRVEQEGFKVVPGEADVVVRLRLAEAAGRPAPVMEQRGVMDIHGQFSGRSVNQSAGAAMMDVLIKGQEQPAWSQNMVAMNATRFRNAQIDEQTVRQSMLEALADSVSHAPLVYFVPKNAALSVLPARLE